MRLRLSPRGWSWAAGRASGVAATVLAANLGNADCVIREVNAVGLFDVEGAERAIGRTFRSADAEGGRILERLAEELEQGTAARPADRRRGGRRPRARRGARARPERPAARRASSRPRLRRRVGAARGQLHGPDRGRRGQAKPEGGQMSTSTRRGAVAVAADLLVGLMDLAVRDGEGLLDAFQGRCTTGLVSRSARDADDADGGASCGCDIPPPCWMPTEPARCQPRRPGQDRLLRIRVTNCDASPAPSGPGRPTSRATARSRRSLDARPDGARRRLVSLTSRGHAGTARIESLIWVHGCNDVVLRWTVSVGTRGATRCHELAVDDCPDFLHHWYDHFYCVRPCPSPPGGRTMAEPWRRGDCCSGRSTRTCSFYEALGRAHHRLRSRRWRMQSGAEVSRLRRQRSLGAAAPDAADGRPPRRRWCSRPKRPARARASSWSTTCCASRSPRPSRRRRLPLRRAVRSARRCASNPESSCFNPAPTRWCKSPRRSTTH